MTAVWVLTKKELRSYFSSPIAYIVAVLFLGILGFFYSNSIFMSKSADLRALFSIAHIIYLVFIPAISMRLISEEKRSGTIEVLGTMPLTDWQLVLGKFIPAFILMLITLLFTLINYFTVSFLGDPDTGVVLGGYLGLVLLAAAYLSIGIFTSSLTSNQIVAFITSFTVILLFFVLNQLKFYVGGFLASILEFISSDYHFQSIQRGVIDSRNVIFYVTITFLFIFLTVQVLQSRKWR
ncbi:MAG TPA: ABC transporter [candidate division Zixibacteria bacterium]|nr:ABC transporter [candidate division Zixibacteria bacterium]HEQ98975.1 ABC transporter [candidate division Zixibacteria bacterium]